VSRRPAQRRKGFSAGIEKAISLINEHREVIHELADELMVKISLDEKELADWYVIALSKETECLGYSAAQG
jgi:hypothetical protein